jgi:type I restriction enzyme, S subunit
MSYEGNCRLGELFQSRREKGRAGLPLLSVTLNNGLVARDSLDRKQDSSLAPNEHLLVKPGDIAYNMMRMWQGAFGLAHQEGIVSPAYVVLKPKAKIDPEFATYLLKTPRMLYLLWAYSYGITSDRLRLYFADFAKIPAHVPSIERQKKVAGVMRAWDQSAEVASQLARAARLKKKALLQRLIPRVASHEEPPSGWQRVRLGDVAKVNPSRPGRPNDGMVSFVPMEAVSEHGRLVRRYERSFDEVRTGYSAFADGDLLIAKITPCFENGKGALLSDLRNGIGFGSTEFHVVRPGPSIHSGLLAHVACSYEFRRRGESEMEGSAGQKRISADFVKSFRFMCPTDLSAQAELATMLSSIDRLAARYDDLAEKLLAEKRVLFKRIFT